MKTQDILLLGGALVAGSYFLGKGISEFKPLPDVQLNIPDWPTLTFPEVKIPELPKFDIPSLPEVQYNSTLYYWNIPAWVETPKYLLPGVLDPIWLSEVNKWYAQNKPLVEIPGLPTW